MEVLLFPLTNVNLFPGTVKPITVFEPRYIAMVRNAVKTKTPIALAYVEDPHKTTSVEVGNHVPFVREIAGYGLVQIVEERPNGSLLCFVQGEGKVRLGKVIEKGSGFLVLDAEKIQEDNALSPSLHAELSSLTKVLARWAYSNISDPQQRQLFLAQLIDPLDVVGNFATYVLRDYDSQYLILEYDDLNQKVEGLYRMMKSTEMVLG